MQFKFTNQLSNNALIKSNKSKLKEFRLRMFTKFLELINHKVPSKSSIFLKDKSAKERLDDIHTIATCLVEKTIIPDTSRLVFVSHKIMSLYFGYNQTNFEVN